MDEEEDLGAMASVVGVVDGESSGCESSMRAKERGKECYARGDDDGALEAWHEALDLLPVEGATGGGGGEANALASVLRANCAASYMRMKRFEDCIRQCDLSLVLDPSSVKAMWRRGSALRAQGNLLKAMRDFERILVVEPENSAAVIALEDIEDDLLLQSGNQSESAMPQRMIGDEETVEGETSVWAPGEEEEDFAIECIQMGLEELERTGSLPAKVILRHKVTNSSESSRHSIGSVTIEGAFASAEMLRNACNFVRMQHKTGTASSACILANLADIVYPQIWWAGDWPENMWRRGDQCLPIDGVIAELQGQSGRRKIYFVPAIQTRGAPPSVTDGLASRILSLPANCNLTDEWVLP